MTRHKVLIFHRSPESIHNIVNLLQTLHLEVRVESEPRDFLSQILKFEPNFCLIDFAELELKKPEIMTSMVKSIRRILGDELPLILTAESSLNSWVDRLCNAGANGYISKPIVEKEFLEKLLEFIPNPEIFKAKKLSQQELRTPILEIETPAVIAWFFNECAPILLRITDYLENFDVLDQRYLFYEEKIKPHHELFMEMVQAMRGGQGFGGESKPDFVQCLRLYGIRKLRFLVIASALSELLKMDFLKWDAKTKKLTSDPAQWIPFAIKAQDHFGEDSRFGYMGFLSGLVIDLIFLWSEKKPTQKRWLKNKIEKNFDSILQQLKSALNLGKSQKDLELDLYLIPSVILKNLGQWVFALFSEEYPDWCNAVEKTANSPVIIHVLEQKKYGISSNALGSLFILLFHPLSKAYPVFLFQHYPYAFQNSGEDAQYKSLVKLIQ